MSTASLPLPIPKRVTRKVSLLRWLVRLYVALEGIAAMSLVLGCAFWIGLVIDWYFEPPRDVRIAIWLIVILALCYVASRLLFSRVFRKLPDSSLALLLERRYPQLREGLVTIVEAADRERASPLGSLDLLLQTGQEADAKLQRVQLSRIFDFRPLIWKSGVAMALAISIVAFAFLQSDVFGFWMARMRLEETPWPRRVQLTVLNFSEREGKRSVNVARDDSYELEVEASIRDGHVVPELIEIRYRLADGRRGRDTMTQVGKALPGRDDAQLFRYTFKNVVADLEFDVVGGDDRLRNLNLRVVERPQIVRMLLECEFPSYMHRAPQTIPVSGRVELPEGTKSWCTINSNKPLTQVTVYDPANQRELPASIDTESPTSFHFDLKTGREDRTLLVTMLDSDGVRNREPYRMVVSAIIDQPPEISVQLRGIGSAVTPQAIIPLSGQISDEYGIEEAWFSYQVGEHPPEKRPLESDPRSRRQLKELGHFDLAESENDIYRSKVEVKPGQQLNLSVKARDAYNLSEDPHVGSSQRFLLDIVTASDLRALLEKRELGLRQRFEAIYEKMIDTGDLLARIEIKSPDPGDEPVDETERERRSERDRLRVGLALQNVTQLAYETLGVADGFDAIVEELVNNRVDTEELKQRLSQGIAEPLREIGNQPMPELEDIIQKLEAAFTDREKAEQLQEAAVAQADVVSAAMKEVLDRMLELESYNELVELLRGIVAEQKQLQEKTIKERREKLRSLLDDE